MFKSHNGIYGNPDHHATFSRVGSDSQANFEKNSLSQPSDWIYNTKDVTYRRNSYGHRSVEPTKLVDGYILFVGCSITEGIALALEDTYAYKVSQELGVPYYNLALNGFGPDLVAQNLSAWFNEIKISPAAVVIQWPQAHRKFEKTINNEIVPVGPWGDRNDNTDYITSSMWKEYEKVASTSYMEHYFNVLRTITINYLEAKHLKIVEIMPNDVPTVDVARDLTHPGIESHQKLTWFVSALLSI